MGWKWDYFQKVSVFENNKYNPGESNIYLVRTKDGANKKEEERKRRRERKQ